MIELIKINLNQAESEQSKRERIREKYRWAIFAFLIFVFLVLNVGMFYINTRMDELIDLKKSQVAEIKDQINQLQKKGKNVSRRDILSLERLESERIFWAKKLMALGNQIPDDMAITRLDFKGSRLIINGVARIYKKEREFDVVDYLVRRLQTDDVFARDFERIKFSNYSRLKIKNQDIVSFEIEAYLKSAPQRKTLQKRKNLIEEIG